MKRLLIVALFAAAPAVFAQEPAPAREGGAPNARAPERREAAESETAGDPWLKWRAANFLILALGLGYLIARSAPEFYRSRSAGIQKAIAEATEIRLKAEARAAEIEARLASLGAEIEKLRAESHAEMAHEAERTQAETRRLMEKVGQQAEQDILSAAKHARADLKTYAATLALEMAAERLRAELTPQLQQRLVEGFERDLEKQRLHREAH